MKKLLIFMIMLGVFLIPRYTTHAALTPPASYDYSFAYNAIDGEFQFSDGTDTYTPEFTRTVASINFDYTYTGDADGLLPFQVTLTFSRSNTSWTLGTTGYIATDTKIGSDATVGAVAKFNFNFINNSNNDFLLYYDMSSMTNTTNISNITNSLLINMRSFNLYQFQNLSTEFMKFYFFSKMNHQIIYVNNQSFATYLDAIYWDDLGQSAAYTAGVESTTAFQEGYETGYGFGYQAGVEEDNAYALGYARGLTEGADMETGSSIIVFVVGAIGFIMMIFGFTTKRRIFNLLSVGAFIVLGGLLAQYVGFIIITIGLVIVNVYYTFWGEI